MLMVNMNVVYLPPDYILNTKENEYFICIGFPVLCTFSLSQKLQRNSSIKLKYFFGYTVVISSIKFKISRYHSGNVNW